MTDETQYKKVLKEYMGILLQSLDYLMLSVDKCSSLTGKERYEFEELESFDSLTSKYSRTSDIYTQKVLRTIWILLHEPFVPFIDFVNKAEKLNMIESAYQLLSIRDLRNQITHEYIPEAITQLIPEVLKFSEVLKNNINNTKGFIENRDWL